MKNKITVVAPVNIAVIKYWGKRNTELNLPLNDSISVTLDTNVMCAKTTVIISPNFEEDLIWINGKNESFENPRLKKCLIELKRRAIVEESVERQVLMWKVHICSENNFPTAAGLASSAAGYACLVWALARLYNLKMEISAVARLGSGSACRSIYGGFVRWHAGEYENGLDSLAVPIAPASHWPELRALILVVGDTQKKISSTLGMKLSVETSDLLHYRVENCVPKRTCDIVGAIKEKNFSKFGEITMKESNQFHAICLDSYPPLVYMTEVSHKICELVHCYNKHHGDIKVAYTFDAGSNACLYLLENEVPKMISLIKYVFPSSSENFITGLPTTENTETDFLSSFAMQPQMKDLVKYVIHTKIGEGPSEVFSGHLLNDEGEPITK